VSLAQPTSGGEPKYCDRIPRDEALRIPKDQIHVFPHCSVHSHNTDWDLTCIDTNAEEVTPNYLVSFGPTTMVQTSGLLITHLVAHGRVSPLQLWTLASCHASAMVGFGH